MDEQENQQNQNKDAGKKQEAAKSGPGLLQNVLVVAIATLIVGLLVGVGITSLVAMPSAGNVCDADENTSPADVCGTVLPVADIASKVTDYVNINLLSDGFTASGAEVTPFNDSLYAISFKVSDGEDEQDAIGFVGLDGKLLLVGTGEFPGTYNVFDLDETLPEYEEPEINTLSCEEVPKEDAAVLEAFVVSYCPYGLQAQRALVPVARLLGMDVVQIKYIGDVVDGVVTAMHGETEAEENHRQICIREEQPDKFLDYLACFMKEGETDACLTEVGVDTVELDACMSGETRGIAYAQADFDASDSYGVTGSPTIIVNGQRISEFDFAAAEGNLGQSKARSSENLKQLLCCAFNSIPGECSTELSTENAAIGLTPEETGTGAGTC